MRWSKHSDRADLTHPQHERKRMARLLITDVTLLKSTELRAQLRFRGGATHTLTLPLPKPGWNVATNTRETVVSEVDRLLEEHTEGEIADLLNSQGMISGEGKGYRSRSSAIKLWFGHSLLETAGGACSRSAKSLRALMFVNG